MWRSGRILAAQRAGTISMRRRSDGARGALLLLPRLSWVGVGQEGGREAHGSTCRGQTDGAGAVTSS